MPEGIQFEEDQIVTRDRGIALNPKISPVAKFFISTKLLRTEQQAMVAATLVAVVILILGIVFIRQALAEPVIIELRVQ